MKRQVDIYNNYKEKEVVGTGLFCQWGTFYEEFESGAGNYTTAIVEMEDGTIETPEAGLVRFVK